MALNINLFVHGVPMGQKIWGPKGDDHKYLSTFYGPKWNAPEVMKVDVMTLGSTTYCYYSLVIGQNVCDNQGRAGSYFALTLRINAYYADVKNIYNVLKSAYDKMCVGLCVEFANNVVRYKIADFDNVDTQLKAIEKNLIGYISEFSVNEDIVGLSGLAANPQGSNSVNLHECTKKVAYDLMKKGGLMVSPCYLSASAAKTVAQYKAEVAATKNSAQQEIQAQQETSLQKINAITMQSQQELGAVKQRLNDEIKACKEQAESQLGQMKEECQRKIREIKENYAEVDQTIDKLKKNIQQKDRDISELELEVKRSKKKLQNKEDEIQKLEGKVAKLECEAKFAGSGVGVLDPDPLENKYARLFKNKYVIGAISVFVVLLLGLLIFFVVSVNKGKKDKLDNLRSLNMELENKVDSLQQQIESIGHQSSFVVETPNNDEADSKPKRKTVSAKTQETTKAKPVEKNVPQSKDNSTSSKTDDKK